MSPGSAVPDLAPTSAAANERWYAVWTRSQCESKVEEGLRRDIHFLGRHPSCLFQCLWNSGWWYDCPQTVAHYAEGRSPGQQAGVGLHRLLERWREFKEQTASGWTWLRSLRPTR